MKYGLLAVFNKNKSWLGMQLEQSQGEGMFLCLALCCSSCGFIVPQPALAAGSSQGFCPASTQGGSHFRLQRCWNNAAAHQREERMIPHPTGAVGHTFPVLPVLPASGQFGSSLADEPSCSSLIKALC